MSDKIYKIRDIVPPVGANHTEWHAARDQEIRRALIAVLDRALIYRGGPDYYRIDGDDWCTLRANLLGEPPPKSNVGQGGPS